MQEKEKKNRRLKGINNVSSMMIFIVFLILCVIIAAVIGIYSVKKKEQKDASSVAAGEHTQEQSGGPETHGDETASKEDEETEDLTQTGEGETTVADTKETQSNTVQDIIFEECGEEGVLVTMIHTGGWGGEDDPFMQYDIVISNTTDADISEWCIKIKVGADADCNNIWNGTAELENGVLTITSADFNGTIVSGTQASLGIIIEKPGTPAFEDVTFK